MSLVWRDPFDYYRPSRILDQQFGMGLDPEDLLAPVIPREFQNLVERPWSIVPREFRDLVNRSWNTLADVNEGSEVRFDKDKFNVNVDVQQFKPNEISVKVSDTDNMITIEGKHEERPDEHGYISRQFTRRYVLPKDHDVSKVESRLSSDGVLTITAPRIGDPQSGERQIPITHTGKPSKAIKDKKSKKK